VPSVSVSTTWPGATPAEVESEILEKQEKTLKSLPGLARMTSEARRNRASIDLELDVGTSLDEALVRVSNLLGQVPDYPPTARRPVISTARSTGPPFIVAAIQTDPPGDEVAEYRTWVDEVVKPRLDRIPGVASIRLAGGQDEEVHIDFDPDRLASRSLTVGQLVAAVRPELVDISGGDIPIGKRRYTVRTQVAPTQPEELERTVLKSSADGTPILLGQVATVRTGLRKPEAFVMGDGNPSLVMLFFREAGTNVLEVTWEVHRVIAELQEEYLAAEGLQLRIVSDETEYLEGALRLVRNNLLIGGALAILVLLLFLRSIGASAVVALAIPISIIGTALALSAMGRTVNVVSLAGMAFAVGMVVDNSIVVLENIDTWRRRESDMAKAALLGAREVWAAILASTLTTAAVFLPVISWQDEVGELLRDVAMAISTAVFASLIVSVLVIPTFASKLLKHVPAERPDEGSPSDAAQGTRADAVHRFGRIGASVHWLVRSRVRALALAIVGIVGTAGLGLAMVPALEYLPTGNRNIVFGILVPPPGYSVQEMHRIGDHVFERFGPHMSEHREDGTRGQGLLDRTFYVGTPDRGFMGAVARDPNRVKEVEALVRSTLAEIPDVIGMARRGSLFGRRLGGGRTIEIDVAGDDLGQITAFAGKLMGALRQAMPGAQIRPIPGLDVGAPELRVEPRRAQAASFGISSAEIGLLVDAYVDGAIVGELAVGGERRRDVVLRASNLEIDGVKALENAPAAVPGGKTVPVGRFAKVSERLGPTVIQRIERRRAITLQVSPPEEIALEEAIELVERDVVGRMRQDGEVPSGIHVSYAGSAGKLAETKTRFLWVLLLAIVISYLLLSALFEDFLAPLAILISVPLAASGGVLGLRAVDATLGSQSLDMMTAMGFLILIGVVVNNAILIVDGALARMRHQGLVLEDAVASAVKWRVRPIFMAALTSMAGLLPLVLFPGFGSELYRGVGGVVLGGLALSTLLSLFLVPAVFTLLWRVRRTVS